jgi:predicted kinase
MADRLLEVLVGLPGSGKSTYAQVRAKSGACVVDWDSIVLMLHAGDYSLYREELQPLYKSIETIALVNSMLCNQDVVFDKCCNRRDTRQRIINLGHQFGAKVRAVIFRTGRATELACRRTSDNSRGYRLEDWHRVIQCRINDSDPVDASKEEFDEITVVNKAMLDKLRKEIATQEHKCCCHDRPKKISDYPRGRGHSS